MLDILNLYWHGEPNQEKEEDLLKIGRRRQKAVQEEVVSIPASAVRPGESQKSKHAKTDEYVSTSLRQLWRRYRQIQTDSRKIVETHEIICRKDQDFWQHLKLEEESTNQN